MQSISAVRLAHLVIRLKSSASKFGNRVIDGAYAAMHRAILSDQTPNLFFLHYKLPQLTVESVSPPPWTQGQLRSNPPAPGWRSSSRSSPAPSRASRSVPESKRSAAQTFLFLPLNQFNTISNPKAPHKKKNLPRQVELRPQPLNVVLLQTPLLY